MYGITPLFEKLIQVCVSRHLHTTAVDLHVEQFGVVLKEFYPSSYPYCISIESLSPSHSEVFKKEMNHIKQEEFLAGHELYLSL